MDSRSFASRCLSLATFGCLAIAAGGCSPSAAPCDNSIRPSQSPADPVGPIRPSGGTPQPNPAPAAVPGPRTTAVPPSAPTSNIPANARFTLFCFKLDTPDHIARGDALQARMKQLDSQRDWYVVHNETETTLYCGYYAEIDSKLNAREAKRAQVDRSAIEAMTVNGQRVFPRAIFVPLDSPDPDAPAGLDIAKVDAAKDPKDPTRAYWTLEIGVYTGSADRKQAAVEAVKAARAMGVEAYYFHGPTSSSVLIGAWPKSAVTVRDIEMQNNDPSQTLYVPGSSGAPTPSSMRDREGRPIKKMSAEMVINDPKVAAAVAQYHDFAVNGEVDTFQTSGGQRVAKATILKPIPRGDELAAETGSPAETVRAAPAAARPRGGTLRRIGG